MLASNEPTSLSGYYFDRETGKLIDVELRSKTHNEKVWVELNSAGDVVMTEQSSKEEEQYAAISVIIDDMVHTAQYLDPSANVSEYNLINITIDSFAPEDRPSIDRYIRRSRDTFSRPNKHSTGFTKETFLWQLEYRLE